MLCGHIRHSERVNNGNTVLSQPVKRVTSTGAGFVQRLLGGHKSLPPGCRVAADSVGLPLPLPLLTTASRPAWGDMMRTADDTATGARLFLSLTAVSLGTRSIDEAGLGPKPAPS